MRKDLNVRCQVVMDNRDISYDMQEFGYRYLEKELKPPRHYSVVFDFKKRIV